MKSFAHKLFSLAAVFGMLVNSHAQTIEELPKLKEIKESKQHEDIRPMKHKSGLWGYANADGKFIIKPVFNGAFQFEGDVARVNWNGKWGTVSRRGLFVVEPTEYVRFDEYTSDSLAVVKDADFFYLIDAKGRKVQETGYDEIEYADYGYKVRKNGRYGTIDKKGTVFLAPQFDNLLEMDKGRGLEFIQKGDKWGILQDGKDVLSLEYDTKPYTLKSGDHELYLVEKDGKRGVITPYARFVVPCVYDDIISNMTDKSAESGQSYYITHIGNKYGAINYKMNEMLPPVNDAIPDLGERLFRMHYDGVFYAGNCFGIYPFDVFISNYYIYKEVGLADELDVAFRSIPDWAKTEVLENNAKRREEDIHAAGTVKNILAECGYDAGAAALNESMPKEIELSIPADVAGEQYGIMDCGQFVVASGLVSDHDGGNCNLHFKAESPSGCVVNFVQMPGVNEYFCTVDGNRFPVRKALTKFAVKEFDGMYPVEFAILPDERLMVRFAFIRSSDDPSSSLQETESQNLPLPDHQICLHKGGPDPAVETHVIITFDMKTYEPASFVQFPSSGGCRVSGSCFGGFYIHSDGPVIVDPDNTLKRFDKNGCFDWEYRPRTGEKFYGIEETENFIYLCGSTINTEDYGVEVPFIVQLTKRGEKSNEMTLNVRNALFSGMICRDHLIYAKTDFLNERAFGADYYPHFLLEDFGDNFGVRHKCVWEQWGDGLLGGCGLVGENGEWLKSPILPWQGMPEEPYYDWEFAGFESEHLVFRHHGKYGLMNKEGKIVIEPKYDVLELLDNPMYARVSLDRQYGVIDAIGGKVIVPLEYDYVGRMSEDVIIVARDGLYGCFDKDGKMTVPAGFLEIREFSGGMARARDPHGNKNMGLIDKEGNWAIDPFCDDLEDPVENCVIVVSKGRTFLAEISDDGAGSLSWDYVSGQLYDEGSSMSEGLACMGTGGKFGYVNKKGEFVIPQRYSHATDFHNGLASVAVDGKWGVIDNLGNVVVPFEYEETLIASDKYIRVMKDGKYGICKTDRTVFFPAICDSIELYEDGSMFRYGVANARYNGNERIRIDELGHIVWNYSR